MASFSRIFAAFLFLNLRRLSCIKILSTFDGTGFWYKIYKLKVYLHVTFLSPCPLLSPLLFSIVPCGDSDDNKQWMMDPFCPLFW